jgi:mannose-6-phosphate isomerase-like protein (cupin superfamily)
MKTYTLNDDKTFNEIEKGKIIRTNLNGKDISKMETRFNKIIDGKLYDWEFNMDEFSEGDIMDSFDPPYCCCRLPYDPSVDSCPEGQPCTTTRCVGTAEDFGPNPYVVNIEEVTLENPFYRRALWTGVHLQLTLMCIPPGGDIGLEVHPNLDQFLRLEQGEGRVMMGPTENSLNFQQDVSKNSAIFVPAGTWHNVVNTGDEPIKLYSIYAPVQHPRGILQCTKADATD